MRSWPKQGKTKVTMSTMLNIFSLMFTTHVYVPNAEHKFIWVRGDGTQSHSCFGQNSNAFSGWCKETVLALRQPMKSYTSLFTIVSSPSTMQYIAYSFVVLSPPLPFFLSQYPGAHVCSQASGTKGSVLPADMFTHFGVILEVHIHPTYPPCSILLSGTSVVQDSSHGWIDVLVQISIDRRDPSESTR